jgi:hypothetical protein
LIEDRLAGCGVGVGFDGGFDGGFDLPLMSLMIPQPAAPSARDARQQRVRKRFLNRIVSQNPDHFAELEMGCRHTVPGLSWAANAFGTRAGLYVDSADCNARLLLLLGGFSQPPIHPPFTNHAERRTLSDACLVVTLHLNLR